MPPPGSIAGPQPPILTVRHVHRAAASSAQRRRRRDGSAQRGYHRTLRGPRSAGPRRHGRGVCRLRSGAGSQDCRQAVAHPRRERGGRQRRKDASSAGGAGDRAVVAPQRRHRLRRRHVPRIGVHRHGVRRGAHPRLLAAGRDAWLARGARRLRRGRPRSGGGARGRSRPPGLQARERDDRPRAAWSVSWTLASPASR